MKSNEEKKHYTTSLKIVRNFGNSYLHFGTDSGTRTSEESNNVEKIIERHRPVFERLAKM